MSDNNYDFTYKLIKGKIAEIIFEMMFRHTGKYKILHFGYEYNFPELVSKDIHNHNNEEVLKSISTAPDFIEVDNDDKVTLVEVKYRSELDGENHKEIAEKLLEKWPESWLFIVTKNRFLFDSAKEVVARGGFVQPLSTELISKEDQDQYLNILRKFNL